MIYTRWTVDFEMSSGRPLESYFEKASWQWIRLVVLDVAYLGTRKRYVV